MRGTRIDLNDIANVKVNMNVLLKIYLIFMANHGSELLDLITAAQNSWFFSGMEHISIFTKKSKLKGPFLLYRSEETVFKISFLGDHQGEHLINPLINYSLLQ